MGTLLTEKPWSRSLGYTFLMVLFITGVTQFYWLDPLEISSFFPAVKKNIFQSGEIWRLWSAMLIHGDIGHLLSNLYMLSIFTYFIIGYFKLKAFWLLTLVGGSLVNLFAISTYAPNVRLLGASGLVYLFGGFWLGLYMFIQTQHSFTKRIVRVFGMGLMVFFPTTFEATTSYRTHFIGFVVGLLFGITYFVINRKKIRKKDKYTYV